MLNKKQIRYVLDTMGQMFPNAHCELIHRNPFELTIAVLLSAQTTDENVNRVTRDLFEKYKTPEDYLAVDVKELEEDIRSIGLFRTKAKNIQKLRSEEHTSELQSRGHLVCRLLLEKKNN